MGDCWEIKDKIGEKKNSGGQKFSGGTFWGNAKKGVEKLFGGSKKWWEFFWGSQQFLGGEFLEKCQRKKFRGEIFGGVVRRGRAIR